jgi:hypothetical protein
MKLLAVGSGAVALAAALAMGWNGPAPRAVPEQPGRVSSTAVTVVALSPEELAKASQTIDRLVEADLQRNGQKPNPPASDETFLRRAYLAIVGRIPTTAEAVAFLAASGADKRATLIDRLLASEGHVSGEFTYWADQLRATSVLGGQRYPGQPWLDWIKQSIRENKPYDRFVAEMLTADGPALATGNGATGFYLRDAGMPLDHTATTASIFLATQIGCAQCHNHPFDVWQRRQFFEFAAYTAGSDARRNPPGGKEYVSKLKKQEGELPPELKQTLKRLGETLWARVNGTGKSTINLPDDYQYDDAKPKTVVAAKAIFGDAAPVAPKKDPREAFAAWMTSPENPRFTLAVANRQWKRAFGVGVIEPADALTDESKAVNPELMDFLVRLMVSVKYDLRAYQAALYKSQAWQRQATAGDIDPGQPYRFPGPMPRRLTAEQAWDSLLTLTVPDVDGRKGESAEGLTAFYEENKDLDAEGAVALAKDMANARAELKQLQEEGNMLRKAMQGAKGDELKKLRERQKAIVDKREELTERAEIMRYRKAGGQGKNARKKPDQGGPLLRASELPQPAPPGHFLRVFGQSDREVIDNASASPAVTQALFLLNGPVDAELAKPTSVLSQVLASAGDDLTRIRCAYVAILSRQPTAQELVTAAAYLRSTPDGGLHDLCWALVNGNEFLFTP